MSGHSKWANIKTRKDAQDKKRSETFTRAAKNILTAIRQGGGVVDPNVNYGLRVAIEKAREVNMPKENVDRLLSRFLERRDNLQTYMIEGFAPHGVPVMIEVESDNKNRSLGEIKLIFRNHNATVGESGSVGYMFDRVGEMELESISEEDYLKLIDLGVMDILGKEVYVEPNMLAVFKEKITKAGFKIVEAKIGFRPKSPIKVEEKQLESVLEFLSEIEEHEEVIGVFAGLQYEETL